MFDSPYFETVDEALAGAANLVTEDREAAHDRQVVANFYNGRDTMTASEAEKANVKNVVNHLFGYSALDQLRQQITSILTSDDQIWTVKCNLPGINGADKQSLETTITTIFNKRIKKSKRLKPEWRAVGGNVVLHGRDCLTHVDNFDWCPRSSFMYVPGDTGTTVDTFTYAFKADRIPLWRLKSYLKKAKAADNGAGWNIKALEDAIEAIHAQTCDGTPTAFLLDSEEKESENTNQEDSKLNGRRASSQTMPVWYLYEVDHDKGSKPVALTIIARYTYTGEGQKNEIQQVEREKLLFTKKEHFKSVHHWLKPFFIDTEIGGVTTWHSTMGIGKLNFPRDADVEEFFNMAMDGAKDSVRTKWVAGDGASREKIARFFAERGDVVPEGLTMLQQPSNTNYQHALNIVGTLRVLSKEDAGSGFSSVQGQEELEIQAQERQSKASALVASRMSDIYDSLDDVGSEILRRFLVAPNPESSAGYADVKAFRDECDAANITEQVRKQLAEDELGIMKWITVRTSRAAGDGSPTREMAINDRLMAWIGMFSPEAQEIVKRRVVMQTTKDPDWTKEVLPYERRPDPDQLARARNENSAALARGITGFVPELSADDVSQIHAPEHDNAIDAEIAKATEAGMMDPVAFAGIKSLMTHQMMHVQSMKGDKILQEQANTLEQKVQEQARQCEGLQAAYDQNKQDEEISAAERIKFQQKERDQELRERSQISIEEDRQFRREIDVRDQALAEVKTLNDASSKTLQVTQPQSANAG